jgi:hypothetical protein
MTIPVAKRDDSFSTAFIGRMSIGTCSAFSSESTSSINRANSTEVSSDSLVFIGKLASTVYILRDGGFFGSSSSCTYSSANKQIDRKIMLTLTLPRFAGQKDDQA